MSGLTTILRIYEKVKLKKAKKLYMIKKKLITYLASAHHFIYSPPSNIQSSVSADLSFISYYAINVIEYNKVNTFEIDFKKLT